MFGGVNFGNLGTALLANDTKEILVNRMGRIYPATNLIRITKSYHTNYTSFFAGY